MFQKVVWRKKLRSFDTSNIMTFCQIFEVASRVRQKVVDHRALTIERCSVQEKKVVGDKRSLMAGSLITGSTVLRGGVDFLNRTHYLFHFLSAILHLFHTLPEAKYLFHFLMIFFLTTKWDPKLGLVLMWRLRRWAKWGFTNLYIISHWHLDCFILDNRAGKLWFLSVLVTFN